MIKVYFFIKFYLTSYENEPEDLSLHRGDLDHAV